MKNTETKIIREEDVTFYSGPGYLMAARIYHPNTDGIVPGVVMCHGFGGTKEDNPPDTARLLAAAGYRVLTWDYRGFGGSEGPRYRLIPDEQIEDAMTAVEYFAAREDVEGDCVALWGSSFGAAMSVGAIFRRSIARCAVLVVPVVCDSKINDIPPELNAKARAALVQKTRTGKNLLVDRSEVLRSRSQTAGMSYPVSIEIVSQVHSLAPLLWAQEIVKPIMIVAAGKDSIVPVDGVTDFHSRLRGPKEMHVFHDGEHYSAYREHLADTVELGVRWLKTHLA